MRLCRLFVKMKAEYRSVVLSCIELVFRDLFRVKGNIFADTHDGQIFSQFLVDFAGVCLVDTNELGGGRVKRDLLRKNSYQICDCAIFGNK